MRRLAIAAGVIGVAAAACATRSPGRVDPVVATPVMPAALVAAPVPAKRITPDAPFRAQPPPVSSPAPFVPPEPVTLRLRNGIPLTLVHQTSSVLAVAVVAAGGVVDIGAEKVETVDLMLTTMMAGSKTRDSDALEDTLADLAMPRFRWTYFSDGVVVSALMPSQKVQAGVKLIADVALHPAFDQKNVAWYANVLAGQCDAAATNVAIVGEDTLRKALFAQHPYSAINGSSAAVRAVKRADVVALHARLFNASRLSIVAAGGVNDKDVFAAVDAAFGGLARGEQAPRAPAAATVPAGPRIVVVDRPGASVTRIDLGFVGPAAGAADVDAAEVALQVLAGKTFGRISVKLRKDLHAAWVNPNSYRLRSGELLALQSKVPTEYVSAALAEIERQIKTFAEGGPTDDELSILHDGDASDLGALVGTPAETAWTYACASVIGLPPDSVKHTITQRAALSAAAIRSAAARWLDPARMRIVLVGDWAAMRESVTKLGWSISQRAEETGRVAR